MDNTFIDINLISSWKKLKGRSEKSELYFNELRPAITAHLYSKIEAGIAGGRIDRYGRLIVVVGNDANPALIIAGALKPVNMTVLFSGKNRRQLEKRFLPEAVKQNPECIIELIEIDYCNHDENYRSIIREFKNYAGSGPVICDITGGKKITSGHLAIIARKLGFDICYLDAENYVENSAVPEPGNESLYIHKNKGDELYEFSAKVDRVLFISSVDSNRYIVFNYGLNGDFFKFQKRRISKTIIKTIRNNLEAEYKRIDHGIKKNISCSVNLDEISVIVRSMLFDDSLDSMLRQAAPGNIRLIVDPELSGIPWDAVLAREYGAEIPVCTKLNRRSVRSAYGDVEKHGILLLTGSGEGVEGFDEYKKQLIRFFDGASVKFCHAEARDRGIVQRELSKRRYNIIFYFGHSEFDSRPDKSGWKCVNGEIFPCTDFAVMRHVSPDMIISSSCHSAKSVPFNSNSIANSALEAGAKSFVGARWLLESGRSFVFLTEIIKGIVPAKGYSEPEECFSSGISALKKKYGPDDISIFNYIFYH